MSAKINTLSVDQMTTVEAVKEMTLEQQLACVHYLPCKTCTRRDVAELLRIYTCHRVCDLMKDRGKGPRFYLTCSAKYAHQIKTNAKVSATKREISLATSLLFPSLKGVERYTDAQLHFLVALFMRRPDVAPLWTSGSGDLTYWFFWTCESAAGWGASAPRRRRTTRATACAWRGCSSVRRRSARRSGPSLTRTARCRS